MDKIKMNLVLIVVFLLGCSFSVSAEDNKMKIFKRENVEKHCVNSEWPDFLGKVSLGETFIIETVAVNRVNGPIEIKGVKAGEAIAITIENIIPVGPFNCPNGGPIHEGMGQPLPLTLKDGYFYFPDYFKVKCEPSIGNVAILPERNEKNLKYSQITLLPKNKYKYGDMIGWRRLVNDPRGKHCHQDCKWVRPGSIIHMRVQVDGAGLCIGDVHGYIGEGECAFGAIEIAGDVQLRVEKSSGWLVDWPLIETEDEIMVCCSSSDAFADAFGDPEIRYVDLAREAYSSLRKIVADKIKRPIEDANPIIATAMDLRNCAIYGLKSYVKEWNSKRDGDLSVVAVLKKKYFSE